jgi:hypothetical protein
VSDGSNNCNLSCEDETEIEKEMMYIPAPSARVSTTVLA